ncbi:MAG TPA: glycoside hydrolase family 16 protein [Opitutaceae bacterium]|nr:glycoside hydrolase family 16 protein [Opitutaceae bacterium]
MDRTSAAVRAPEVITSPLGKTMVLKFHDEFEPVRDGDGTPYIDRAKWQTTFWQGTNERTLSGNREAQDYIDKDYAVQRGVSEPEKLNPFSFEKTGILTIKAWRVPSALWKKLSMTNEHSFASGLLISDKRYAFKYGYVEGRFKLPGNRGAWPAFWLLVDDTSKTDPITAHAWPPEMDVFEFFGHRPMKHSAGIIGIKGEKLNWNFGYNETGFDISKDFHTWGLEWNADQIVLTFDGKIWARSNTPESLQRPMYLLINLAVGGKWYSEEMAKAGTPFKPWEVDEASMPWKMECDYVRVYQEKMQ